MPLFTLTLVAFATLVHAAVPQQATTTTATVPSLTVSTAVASPSGGDLNANVPSQVSIPPKQAWCPSEIFCAGDLLQTVNLANLFEDPKTFVDKPTIKQAQAVLSDFRNATQNLTTIPTVNVLKVVENDFSGEGLELAPLELEGFKSDPSFLKNASDPIVKGFAQTVHGYWTQLVRKTNESTLCDGKRCESSLIPLNHTFVVPGGRFREQYYWDSFWIVEGLLASELYSLVNDTLQNFMDELDQFGFIPNGGRIYYLNRSQPPLFIQMLSRYIEVSGDKSILKRAIPLAQKELRWWHSNRLINVTSPTTNKTYPLYRYAVNNTAPRPESYLQDYTTANPNGTEVLNLDQRSALYAELASGAESGWDYTARWLVGGNDLTKLKVRETLPVDLNSILYNDHILLANLIDDEDTKKDLRATASQLKAGVLDLLWNSTKLAFYDFNLESHSQNAIFTVANYYPVWSGIVPPELLTSSDKAFGYYSSVNLVLNRYNGTYPTTFVETGQQWDAPNSWPPHQYITLRALSSLPSNATSGSLPQSNSSFSLIPSGQLGLTEDQLPPQPITASSNATGDVSRLSDGSGVQYGGNATAQGEGWAALLGSQLANRYFASAFCSWRATGGSIPDLVPRLSDEQLNVTKSVGNNGNMFEKFSATDIDSAGRGGEYTVQAGFGWTNGVLLWIVQNYGGQLVAPTCPDLLTSAEIGGSSSNGGAGGGSPNSAVGIRSGIARCAIPMIVGLMSMLWML